MISINLLSIFENNSLTLSFDNNFQEILSHRLSIKWNKDNAERRVYSLPTHQLSGGAGSHRRLVPGVCDGERTHRVNVIFQDRT